MENENELNKENQIDHELHEEVQEEETMMDGLKNVGLGLVILGVAYYFYSTMTSYENGEAVSMNRLLMLAYATIGKNITTGILGLIGAFMTFEGVKTMIAANSKKA